LIINNKVDQACSEWNAASRELDRSQWQRVFEAGMAIAEAYLDCGQVEPVKELYETLRKRFSFVSDVNQVLGAKVDELYWIGRAAPVLEGKDLEGNPIDLATDYKGRVVLIDFWATWCAPCVASLPDLRETYRTYHDKGFDIIGVNLDTDQKAFESFWKRSKIDWPQLCDGQSYRSPNVRKYDVMSIPATFLIDREGKIARVGIPAAGYGPIIERLLAAEPEKSAR
jgi:thiol-disulfide isomerase/thioredoxin